MSKRSINEKIEIEYNNTGRIAPPKGIMKAAQKLENFLKDKELDKYCNLVICLDDDEGNLVQMLSIDCKGNYALAQAIYALLIDNDFGADSDIFVYKDNVLIDSWGDWTFRVNDWDD